MSNFRTILLSALCALTVSAQGAFAAGAFDRMRAEAKGKPAAAPATESKADPSTEPSAGRLPPVGDFPQGEFTVNISDHFPDWRPYKAYNADEAQILTAVYEGLFVYDPWNMDPIPALAESWTVSDDGLVWTFRIRKGAEFETGEPITAGIIRASWLNLLNPTLNAPYGSLLDPIKGAADYRNGVEKDPAKVGIASPDDQTLVVSLVTPTAHLPKILCHHAFAAVHPSRLAAPEVTEATVPVSSGPYRVESVTADGIRFVKNEHYWDRDRVAIPAINLIVSSDAEAMSDRFNRGEINWLGGSVLIDRVLDPHSIHVTPMFSTEYFYFRSVRGPWTDSRVRNALLLAIPWSELRADYLIPATTLVFPIAGYPEFKGLEKQDVEGAKKLLAEAGYGEGHPMDTVVIRIPESDVFMKLATTLKGAWDKIGIKVDIKTLPANEYYNTLKSDDYSVAITSWIGDFADPLAFLEMFRPKSSLNDSGWDNADFEALIVDAAAQKDIKTRYAKLAEAEKLLLAQGVIIPIAHNPSLNVIDLNGLGGWYTNPLDVHPFKFIRFVPAKPLPGVALLP
jgi:oligopeptide transport system substrate-binding protein